MIKDCKMRHENGNCLPAGGFCTANTNICEALQNAYNHGYFEGCQTGFEKGKEQKWILCSERMPEEREWIGTKEFGTTISDEVYVTFESPKGQRFCKHLSFQNGKISRYDQMKIDVWYEGSIPIAWMPLPELYEGEC